MFHRSRIVLLSAAFAAALAACYSAKPTTSVSPLSYPSSQTSWGVPAAPVNPPAQPAAAPSQSPDDPMRLLDMP